MRYMGSKRRLAKDLERLILERVEIKPETTYWEPFVGGCNSFERVAPNFTKAVGLDVNEDLILLWNAVVNDGWVPPETLTKQEYDDLRQSTEHSALRGFAGAGCSFGGVWWGSLAHGGYQSNGEPRNHVAESARSVLKTAEKLMATNCTFESRDYRFTNAAPGDVVYLDPPYAGTSGYNNSDFDHEAYWEWASLLAKTGVHVFASEYTAPDGWTPIFEKALTKTVQDGRTRRTQGIERIWVAQDSGLV